MRRIVFETVGENGRKQRQGWLVPETDELLVIDQRFEPAEGEIMSLDAEDWVITHLPTGFMVAQGVYTEAHTKARAAGLAQAFFRECKALDIDLREPEANKIIARVNSLPREDRLRFWERIQASEDFLELEEDGHAGAADVVQAPPV